MLFFVCNLVRLTAIVRTQKVAAICHPSPAIYLPSFAENTTKTADFCTEYLKTLTITLFGGDIMFLDYWIER